MFDPEISTHRRITGTVIFFLVAIAATVSTWMMLSRIDTLPRTDDASIGAEIAHISAGVPGQLGSVDVAENARVSKGQLLFAIEPESYRLQRDQAQAQVDAARAALADAGRAARATAKNASSAEAEIDRAQSNLKLAEATVARLEPLAADGVASQQMLDEARTVAEGARVSLQVAQQTAGAADDLVANTEVLQAEVRAAETVLALAEHQLARTKVVAPFDGFVTGLTATAGNWVLPEQPVLSLIDETTWHVEAYFRETDLAAIAPEDKVRVRVLSHPQTRLTGQIDSVGRGVIGTEAIEIGGALPFVVRSTDWVRLARRFPVRIVITDPLPDFLRVGASATVTLSAETDQ